MRYPIIIHKAENGTYSAWFPDILLCIAAGDTIDETLENGRDAVTLWIESTLENKGEIPQPTSIDTYIGREGEDYENVVTWGYVNVDMLTDLEPEKTKRINVSVPVNQLAVIDAHAGRGQRSTFMVQSAMQRILRESMSEQLPSPKSD